MTEETPRGVQKSFLCPPVLVTPLVLWLMAGKTLFGDRRTGERRHASTHCLYIRSNLCRVESGVGEMVAITIPNAVVILVSRRERRSRIDATHVPVHFLAWLT